MKERYENFDGIRAYACIAIVLMHVLTNGKFGLTGFVFERLIPSFACLVFLFMMISAFSLCCGYYEKFKTGSVDLERFYCRRYERIWPFFAVLCTLELIIDHSLVSLYEWFANLTLAFGLLPNNDFSNVGVGWFLGVVFVYYMLFPFFVFLIGNKKRAWAALGIGAIYCLLCEIYFFDKTHVADHYQPSHSFIYCFMFFAAGGIIYLYREKISAVPIRYKWCIMGAAALCLAFYYTVSNSAFIQLLLFALFTALGMLEGNISRKAFQNKIARFVGGLSMEIYLSHMFVFRTLEKSGALHITGNETVNYFLASIATICGTLLFAYAAKTLLPHIIRWLKGKIVPNH